MRTIREKQLVRLVAQALGAGVAVSVMAVGAHAQQAQKVEKIEVTGSNIKRVDIETAAPIQVITAEEIRRSGRQTVTEVLRELTINAAGGLTELSGSASFSAGAATASLRGLGSTATLVLLNGRRIAPYGLADPNFGQSAVVNLNAIPLNTIERIEILKDGASAIYGSEAIAGVINIILRKDYKGAQVGATAQQNYDGLYKNQTYTGAIGFGDLAKDRYNVFAAFEYYKQDEVYFNDVKNYLVRPDRVRVYGTGDLSSAFSPFLTYVTNAAGQAVASPGPGCPADQRVPWNFNGFNLPGAAGASGTVCLYDNWYRSTIVPEADRKSVFARGSYDLSGTTQLYGEASVVMGATFFPGFAQAVGFGTGSTFNPSTGGLNASPQFLPAGHPNNPFNRNTFFRGRLDAVGNQDNEVKTETTRFLGGVKTRVGNFDIDAGVLYNRSEIDSYNYNSIRYSQLVAGITGRGFDFYNPNSGAVTADSLRINAKDKAVSEYTIVDLKAAGELGNLPGGPVGVAAGVEFRKEERVVNPQAEKTQGEIFGRGVATVQGSRDVSTIFGELVLPIVKNVEIQIAGRYDKYSDFGNSFTPKVAGSWVPASFVKFRASYAEGFRAPALTEITRSGTSGFFNGVDDPRRCSRPAYTIGCGISIPGLIVANPGVQPEEAKTYSAGFVLEPTSNTNLSVDYFKINRKNEISFLSLTEILLNEDSTDPRFQNRVFRDPTNTNPTVPNDPGAILYVQTVFDNLGETRVSGIDADLRARFSLKSYGQLDTRLVFTHYIDQSGNGVAGAPIVSYSGYRNAPENRAQFTNTWSVGPWANSVNVSWLDKFSAYSAPEYSGTARTTCSNPNGSYYGICRVKEYVTVDLTTEYRGFKNLRLSAAVRNVANSKPSDDPLTTFNTIWYQPQGRRYSVGAQYSF